MEAQRKIKSTDVLYRELFELKNEYYKINNSIANTSNKSNSINKINYNEIHDTAKLNSSHHFYKQIVKNNSNIIFLTDIKGRITECSQGFCKIIEKEKTEIRGNYFWETEPFILKSDDADDTDLIKLREVFIGCIISNKTHTGNWNKINLFKNKDSIANLSYSISMINNIEEPIVMIVFKNNNL